MENRLTDLLCCPECKGNLTPETNPGREGVSETKLYCHSCSKHFKGSEGYYDFVNSAGLIFRSRRDRIIRSIYAKMYTPVTNFMFLFCGGARNARNEVLSSLHLRDGAYVLETGMGYGENFLWLDRHAKDLKLYGLDIQKEMMVNCTENLLKWKIRADIVRADALSLPFRNESFDIVFHLGAINLFSDKKKAIEEMIRVAKPRTHIVIADETEKAGRLFSIFTGPAEKIIPPVDFIPDTMKNINLKTIWKGYGYLIEFDT
jgi:SAM-dependent methyltransferase